MATLPDLEAWAIFAKVVDARSFAGAAAELGLSKATVSKAVSRLEARLGTRLFHRTSRRVTLTEAGRALAPRAQQILADAEAAETEALAQSAEPRGLVRLAAPMSFGIAHVAPALPDFFAAYPQVSVDLQLSDAVVDLIGGGFDMALRIAALPDSALVARRLCAVQSLVVASPAYLAQEGTPHHPHELATRACLGYTHTPTPETWRFRNAAGQEVSVRATGPLRANSGDGLLPALRAGQGIAVLPDFIVGEDVAAGRLVTLLEDWRPPPIALHLVLPPGGPRPARVEVLVDYLVRHFARPRWRTASPAQGER